MKIEFLPNEGDENEGLGDAGIETYRGSPYASIGRECGQNSNDAKDGSGEPVLLKFNLIEVSRGDLQAMDQLEQALELCADKAAKNNDEKEITFFHRAIGIPLPSIPVPTPGINTPVPAKYFGVEEKK